MAVETEIVAEDAMSRRTVTRLALPASDVELRSFLSKGPTADESLTSLMDGITEWMVKKAPPDPGTSVVCRGKFWCAEFLDSEERLRENHRISALDCSGLMLKRGWSFIQNIHPPLSAEAGYARLYFEAWRGKQALASGDLKGVYHSALKIGLMDQELRMRHAFITIVEKKTSEVRKNRQNGIKGGQAERRAERLTVLNRLALSNLQKFQFVSDIQARRNAKSLAAAYDRTAETPLFTTANGLLSEKWFDTWLADFRIMMLRNTEMQR